MIQKNSKIHKVLEKWTVQAFIYVGPKILKCDFELFKCVKF